jgi:CheY-like chemotaxis protein
MEPSELRGSETILLVEDEELVRTLTARVLAQYGYRVVEASNGGEAFLICEQHEGDIDLMITDIVMPRLSGRDLARRLGALREDMKVLFMSGYTESMTPLQDVLGSNKPFIEKPFTPSGLATKVREVLQTRE